MQQSLTEALLHERGFDPTAWMVWAIPLGCALVLALFVLVRVVNTDRR